MRSSHDLNRRRFLQLAGAAAAAAGLLEGKSVRGADAPPAAGGGMGVSLVSETSDAVASSAPVQWAVNLLADSLKARGAAVRIVGQLNQAGAGDLCIAATSGGSEIAKAAFSQSQLATLTGDEALAIIPAQVNGRAAIVAAGADVRGLVYALTELNDLVQHSADARAALLAVRPIIERPANRIRAIGKLFVTDVEDKAWFHDRAGWESYLTMLVSQRFNRFCLHLGLGYDAPSNLRDAYFYFAYPFLFDVPGYSVRVVGLSNAERDASLQTLRFISEQAAARGLQFQIGLWTHAFRWENSPNVNYTISGLSLDTQAPYCREAIKTLLLACPAITGLTLRVHGESGVPEGSYDFWKALFSGIVACGRKVEIDMHAKGMDQPMIDIALATGLPVKISPKFWAEHNGLPYMPASIRQQEMPPKRAVQGAFSLSSGSRSFLRYSYGDLLTRDRKYGIIHRVWPGTQRLLLWADPVFAAEYGRIFSFCGSDGVEFFEPLTFKGRKGSGLPGGRDGYADVSLRTPGGEWRKYLQTYRLWGRLTYNPDTGAEVLQRQFIVDFGAAAPALQSALAKASRILPMITSAHDPSAANYNYWPEIYTNMSVFDPNKFGPYTDTARPRVFNTVSSLDPQLFATVEEFAESLISGKPLGKCTPAEVAQQLEDWSSGAMSDLAAATAKIGDSNLPAYRRLTIDAAIAAGIGRFFAFKIRTAVLFALFDRTGDERARGQSLVSYRLARQVWADMCAAADGVYVKDITFGADHQVRGSWQDRLAAIDEDIAGMTTRAAQSKGPAIGDAILGAANMPAERPSVAIEYTPPATFTPEVAMDLRFSTASKEIASARLWYRHVNQAETFNSVAMTAGDGGHHGTIPAEYTRSPFAMQYYFEIQSSYGATKLHPGFRQGFLGQPYYLVEQA
jgi:hypothetical protein